MQQCSFFDVLAHRPMPKAPCSPFLCASMMQPSRRILHPTTRHPHLNLHALRTKCVHFGLCLFLRYIVKWPPNCKLLIPKTPHTGFLEIALLPHRWNTFSTFFCSFAREKQSHDFAKTPISSRKHYAFTRLFCLEKYAKWLKKASITSDFCVLFHSSLRNVLIIKMLRRWLLFALFSATSFGVVNMKNTAKHL